MLLADTVQLSRYGNFRNIFVFVFKITTNSIEFKSVTSSIDVECSSSYLQAPMMSTDKVKLLNLTIK